jgi:hypothetical protein
MQCPNGQSTDVTLIDTSSRRNESKCNHCGKPFDKDTDEIDAENAPDEDIVDDAGDTDDGLYPGTSCCI